MHPLQSVLKQRLGVMYLAKPSTIRCLEGVADLEGFAMEGFTSTLVKMQQHS